MKRSIEHTFIDTRGEIIEMFPFSRKKSGNYEQNYDEEQNNSNENSKLEELSSKIEQLTIITEKLVKDKSKIKLGKIIEFCTFILVLLTSFGGAFVYLNTQFDNMNTKIDDCLTENDITTLKQSVNKIELWVEGDINNSNLPGADRRLEKIEELLNIAPISVNDSGVASNLLYNSGMEQNNSSVLISLNPTTYLGKDSNGNQYNIEDIINKKVLLTYNEEDKEIYFWGKLNDQLYWHGDCLTNVYNSDGTLYGICESTFNNGNREKYESFYISSDKDEWIYTKRTCENEGNLGISQRYSFKYDKTKNFTHTNARIYDLLYIKDFNNADDKILISSYYGLTQNGVYNDNTGKAYLIKYFMPDDIQIISDKPIIKLLYQGKFVDGQPSDEGYDSWSISREPNTTYMFYKGGFAFGKANSRNKTKEEFENYLTHDRINEYLQKYGFYNYSDYFVTEYE